MSGDPFKNIIAVLQHGKDEMPRDLFAALSAEIGVLRRAECGLCDLRQMHSQCGCGEFYCGQCSVTTVKQCSTKHGAMVCSTMCCRKCAAKCVDCSARACKRCVQEECWDECVSCSQKLCYEHTKNSCLVCEKPYCVDCAEKRKGQYREALCLSCAMDALEEERADEEEKREREAEKASQERQNGPPPKRKSSREAKRIKRRANPNGLRDREPFDIRDDWYNW